jgi:hypothetical protein
MEEFPDRHAYRCLPLSIANAHGWEILCPVAIEIEWNGGKRIEDLKVRALQSPVDGHPVSDFCRSHFSCGIVTFHTDYIFQTGDEWDLLASGPFQLTQARHLSADRDHRDQLAAISVYNELAGAEAGPGRVRKGRTLLLHFSGEKTGGARLSAGNS